MEKVYEIVRSLMQISCVEYTDLLTLRHTLTCNKAESFHSLTLRTGQERLLWVDVQGDPLSLPQRYLSNPTKDRQVVRLFLPSPTLASFIQSFACVDHLPGVLTLIRELSLFDHIFADSSSCRLPHFPNKQHATQQGPIS